MYTCPHPYFLYNNDKLEKRKQRKSFLGSFCVNNVLSDLEKT